MVKKISSNYKLSIEKPNYQNKENLIFANYTEASGRDPVDKDEIFVDPINCYSFFSITYLLYSMFLLSVNVFGVYLIYLNIFLLIVLGFFFKDIFLTSYYPFSFIASILFIVYILKKTFSSRKTKAGFYFHESKNNLDVVLNSEILSMEHKKPGSITKSFNYCPWILNGDAYTAFPYLWNKLNKQPYMRFWVRVPLSHGPKNKNVQIPHGIEDYEAVAVDFILKKDSKKSLLILAGLSGGSNEGYVLDLVKIALKKGWNCFVMLGRGLAGEPCLSDALFHGARTSDAATVARAIRTRYECKHLMMVGISLGGIIVSNGLCRNDFGDYIDAAVCISGCCNMIQNETFWHSRKVWQPLLVHALKCTFTKDSITVGTLRKKIGQHVQKKFDSMADFWDYDTTVVVSLNDYNDAYEYYDDISATNNRISRGLDKPLLLLHSLDDPITSADCNPTIELTSEDNPLSEYLFSFVTEKGGHVGWPLGWAPWLRGWEFQSILALDFLESVVKLRDKRYFQ